MVDRADRRIGISRLLHRGWAKRGVGSVITDGARVVAASHHHAGGNGQPSPEAPHIGNVASALVGVAGGPVLFDLDGTLWDSLPGITRSLAHALEALDLEVPSEAELAANVGPPLPEMLAAFGVPEARLDEGRVIYRERYARLGEFECQLYEGAIELLDDLRKTGRALGTATSKGIEPTERMLVHFGLAQRFDVVAGAPMLGRGHLKADVVADALARLGDPAPETVTMVGDRHYDVVGGRTLGLRTVAVTWGYGSMEELERSEPDAIAHSFGELRQQLGL